KLLVLPWVGLVRAHRAQDGRRAKVVGVQSGADAQEAEDDRSDDRTLGAGSADLADDETRQQPQRQEADHDDDALALVAGDLVIHRSSRTLRAGTPPLADGLAHRRGRPTAPDLGPDKSVRERRDVVGVVLRVVRPHRAVPVIQHLALVLLYGVSLLETGAGARQVEDLPATELEPVAQIQLLAEHEVAPVEEAAPV